MWYRNFYRKSAKYCMLTMHRDKAQLLHRLLLHRGNALPWTFVCMPSMSWKQRSKIQNPLFQPIKWHTFNRWFSDPIPSLDFSPLAPNLTYFQPTPIIALFPAAHTHIKRNFPTDPRVPSISGHLVNWQDLSRTPHWWGSVFLFPWKVKKLLLSFCNSPSLVLYSPKWSTTFFQLNFDFLSPHLFKDWNENIISKCTICFNPSYIWPVSSSLKTSNIQNSQWIYYLHQIPLFLKNIVKSVDTKTKLMRMKEYRGKNFP